MAGELWTAADVARLREEMTAGSRDYREVARALGRTERAVRAKWLRMGMVTTVYSRRDLARLLGCSERRIDHWRELGWLRPVRPHASGPFSQRSLRAFLRAHPDVIDRNRVDMAWLVETLAGGR